MQIQNKKKTRKEEKIMAKIIKLNVYEKKCICGSGGRQSVY